MSSPLSDRIADELRDTARTHDGRYFFDDERQTHGGAEALAVIESCLRLGVPITDRITSAAWLAIIRRLDRIEGQVAAVLVQPEVDLANAARDLIHRTAADAAQNLDHA